MKVIKAQNKMSSNRIIIIMFMWDMKEWFGCHRLYGQLELWQNLLDSDTLIPLDKLERIGGMDKVCVRIYLMAIPLVRLERENRYYGQLLWQKLLNGDKHWTNLREEPKWIPIRWILSGHTAEWKDLRRHIWKEESQVDTIGWRIVSI